MLSARFAVSIFTITIMALVTGIAYGQAYPTKPIRLLAAEVCGGNDFTSRQIAQGISGPLGQPVIVENRAAIIAIETLPKSPPDGYTLLVGGSTIWIQPFMRDNVPWDAARDFLPITMVSGAPLVVVVHPSLPVKSVKELIALAKAKPGELNFTGGANGGLPHLAGELFKSMANIKIVSIPYKGGGLALNANVAGEVPISFTIVVTAAAQIKSGRLRALAVTSAQRSALLPELPTVAAAGVPGYEVIQMLGVFAPTKTPEAIVNRLNQEIVRVVNNPTVKERFLAVGVETIGSTPEQFATAIKADMNRMGKVIKDARIRAD